MRSVRRTWLVLVVALLAPGCRHEAVRKGPGEPDSLVLEMFEPYLNERHNINDVMRRFPNPTFFNAGGAFVWATYRLSDGRTLTVGEHVEGNATLKSRSGDVIKRYKFGTCAKTGAMTEKPVEKRIADRTFPSVFQAWNPADNLREDRLVTAARHDLIFHGAGFFGLQWNNASEGLATGFTAESIHLARAKRRDLLKLNPNVILIMEVRYRDAWRTFLPDGHKWWRRDKNGQVVAGWEEGKFMQLDFSNPEYREQVATQAQAAVATGVVDGVMLDWWQDDDDRVALVRLVRERIGEKALILVNANDRTTPKTAAWVNGYFMECYRSRTAEDWARIARTLAWAEKNLRAPRVNCLETWYHKSRGDESLMRATTALSLALSDGYCLFSDPNELPTPDHLHNWYPFWERRLGRPVAAGETRKDGCIAREFDRGTVVYNPMGNASVTAAFDTPRTSAATGKRARSHTVAGCDGDFFLNDDPGERGGAADRDAPRSAGGTSATPTQ